MLLYQYLIAVVLGIIVGFVIKHIPGWVNAISAKKKTESTGWEKLAFQFAAEMRDTREQSKLNTEQAAITQHTLNEKLIEALKSKEFHSSVLLSTQSIEAIGGRLDDVGVLITKAIHEQTEQIQKLQSLLAEHLAAQRKISRAIEGRGDDENQEIIERAQAVLEQHPELSLEDAISRVRRTMTYAPR